MWRVNVLMPISFLFRPMVIAVDFTYGLFRVVTFMSSSQIGNDIQLIL